LGGSPQKAAEKLVGAVQSSRKEFVEYRLFRPWTIPLSMLRIARENLTKSGKTPDFELHYGPGYKPKI
jgi:hypothetical protein